MMTDTMPTLRKYAGLTQAEWHRRWEDWRGNDYLTEEEESAMRALFDHVNDLERTLATTQEALTVMTEELDKIKEDELFAILKVRTLEHSLELTLKRAEKAEAALAEARKEERERCAKVCERRAADRFAEHGIYEPDTGSSYYGGRLEEEYAARDEEDDECAAAIRALTDAKEEDRQG